jgi:hypothetical protein
MADKCECAGWPECCSSGVMRNVILTVLIPIAAAAQVVGTPPRALPASATTQLAQSLDASRQHTSHVWRDTPAMNEDGTVNAYVEIPRGELRKWEFGMTVNARAIDRVMPHEVGGYPVNYGFVPQTVSYDGDPFDVLVLARRSRAASSRSASSSA